MASSCVDGDVAFVACDGSNSSSKHSMEAPSSARAMTADS